MTTTVITPARERGKATIRVDAVPRSLNDRIIEALREHGPMTADQCAAILRENVLAVRPRFSELSARARIENTLRRDLNETGKPAHVWAVARSRPERVAARERRIRM